MCVRYLTPIQREAVQELVELLMALSIRVPEELLWKRKKPEVAPGVQAPIIVIGSIMVPAVWGFSKWDGKGLVFNARRESLASSPFFTPHLSRGRCLVPATAYFEWEHLANGRRGRKFRIGPTHGRTLFMAGLARRNAEKAIEYTVVTCEATPELKPIHSRMPLLLSPEDGRKWLSRDMDGPLPEQPMTQFEVKPEDIDNENVRELGF